DGHLRQTAGRVTFQQIPRVICDKPLMVKGSGPFVGNAGATHNGTVQRFAHLPSNPFKVSPIFFTASAGLAGGGAGWVPPWAPAPCPSPRRLDNMSTSPCSTASRT